MIKNLSVVLLGAPSLITLIYAGIIIHRKAGSKPLLTFLTPIDNVATMIFAPMISYYRGAVRWKRRTYEPKI